MDGGFLPVEPPTQAFPRVGGGGAGPSGRPPQPAPRCAGAASACARCPALSTTDPEWTAAFSLPLCPSCKAADHLVSRKTAKELYLVTDADLGRLGSLSRANPIGALYAPMKLFLESQVAAVSAARHGTGDGEVSLDPASVAAALEPARAARLEARLTGRSRKRGAVERVAAEAEVRLARARSRIEAHAAEVEGTCGVVVEDGGGVPSDSDSDGVVELDEDGMPVAKQPPKAALRPERPPKKKGCGGGGGGAAKVEREII